MRLRTRRHDARHDVPATAAGTGSAASSDLERVTEAVSSLAVGILVEDPQRRRVLSNELVHHPIGDVQGDILVATALARVVSGAHGGQAASETVELRGVAPRTLELRAAPLTSGGVVATIIDISDRRRLDAIRRDFVANVNHELRTPIGALSLLAEALGDESDPAVVERLSRRIAAEADRATRLLTDLLDFSRVEDRLPVAPERLGLHAVIASAADRVSALAERRAVVLRLPDAGSDAVVEGDRQQLVSAVTNLLDNAIKYSDDGTVVDVNLAVEAGSVLIVVRDEGVGIPAKDLDRIFERFYRVDRARGRGTGGTGLGLAIVRHVATNHGGEVTVTSQEGAGSTFTLRLPTTMGQS